MLAKVLAGTDNTEAVLTIKERTKSVPFAEYLWLDSTHLWKAAGREKLLMLALAETIQLGLFHATHGLVTYLQDSWAEFSLDKYQEDMEGRNERTFLSSSVSQALESRSHPVWIDYLDTHELFYKSLMS